MFLGEGEDSGFGRRMEGETTVRRLLFDEDAADVLGDETGGSSGLVHV